MQLTEDQITAIEEFAELFFSPEEVALMVDCSRESVSEQMKLKEGVFYEAYSRGYLSGDAKIRTILRDMALSGSSPSITSLLEIQKRSKPDL